MIDRLASSRRSREWTFISIGLLLGIGIGAVAALVSPLLVGAGLVALAVAAVLGRSVQGMIIGTVAAATLLPFGTLPFKIGITPTFLELALFGLYGMLVLRGLLAADQPIRWSALAPFVVLLLGFSFFSFIVGSSGSPDPLTAHNYFKLILGVLLFFGVLNAIHSFGEARWLMRLLILAGTAAALLGIGLRFAPDPLALRALTSLAPIGYPDSGRVLRYVEDDPAGFERAIGTSVDPNGFGGLMTLLGALALAQALAANPVLDRRLLWLATAMMALAVFLTSSRAALGGFVVAGLILATVRYRRLWWGIGAGGLLGVVAIVGLGKGGAFAERLIEGVQFQDQANLMRLAEFQNALAIIRAYPVFGVGFGSAPSIDLTTGVSSIYLTIGSRMGLVGLGLYLLTCVAFFVLTTRAFRHTSRDISDAILGTQAAIAAALAVGLLDHYFFNIEFSHMVALFWLVIGLGMVLVQASRSANDAG
ncbi:MAG: O-antigen ligase family protein [Herpetosiphonaceae bacterium]|nr:O-antigen ligase family protein [Herpetosiphonaceae bacterium]